MRFNPPETKATRWIWVLIVGLALVTAGTAWLSVRTVWGARSMSYDVAPAGVTIHFGPTRVGIARAEITGVRVESELSGGRRHVGTSLPGLYEGRWSFERTGPITLFATSLDQLVVIETAGRRFGLSPREPEAFVAAVRTGGSGSYPPVESSAAWGLAALGAVPVVLLAVVLFILFPFLRIAQRMRYELGDDALEIHGAARPISLPYATITDARLEHLEGAPIKSAGVGLPGFYWGSFTWRQAGPNLKLHATRLCPIVLVLSGKNTYGISPEDPEAFLAELLKRIPKRE